MHTRGGGGGFRRCHWGYRKLIPQPEKRYIGKSRVLLQAKRDETIRSDVESRGRSRGQGCVRGVDRDGISQGGFRVG
ncbi:hypothetical protein WN55_00887 [Dufourea novaeangliae]|uniref:Uncharacterized protein n=1 Tax=Dufourea novaeangliae TaxID=178035 RepID=A0A154PD48_DUFNO|nr:hypothetical protein WN55_00887 [Dufourea novaeangliae]